MPGVGISATFDVFLGSGSGSDGLTFTLADASVTKATALGNNGGGEGVLGHHRARVLPRHLAEHERPVEQLRRHRHDQYAAAVAELRRHQHRRPGLRNAWHHVVVTTTSTGHHRDMDGTQVLSYATSLPPYVLVGFTGRHRRLQRHPPGPERLHHDPGPRRPPPRSRAVSPTSGPTTGGTAVTITGTDFTGATAVHFGTAPATSYTVNSSTSITATAPAGTAGTVDVTVTTPAGTSADEHRRPVHLQRRRRRRRR